jgi:hypothetical protein
MIGLTGQCYSNCSPLISTILSILYTEFIYCCMFTSKRLHVYSFHFAVLIITEHVNSMVTSSKIDIKRALFSIQEKLNIITMVCDIYNCPCKKCHSTFHAKHYTCNLQCDAQNAECQLL